MELVRILKQRVTKANQPDPKQIRSFRPTRNEFVSAETSEEGSIVLSAPLETQLSGVMLAISKRMKNVPERKTFSLDPVGAFVWEQCDGSHTVAKIAKSLQERYKMNRLESEAALAAYLQTLSSKRLITMQAGIAKDNSR